MRNNVIYLVDRVSEGMFSEPENTLHRVKLGKNEARELLSRPYTIHIFRQSLIQDMQNLLTLMEEMGFDTSLGKQEVGRLSLKAGDELLVVRVIQAKKFQERPVFSHWKIGGASEARPDVPGSTP